MSPRTTVKAVIIGDGAVGKTAMLWSYTRGEFPDGYEPTVFDNYSCSVLVNGEPITLTLWDTAGQEDFDRLRPLSYSNTDVFIVCFSLVNPISLMNVRQKWIPELRFYCPTAEIVLVGCKSDLADDPLTLRRLHDNGKLSVDEAAARQLACEHGASFVRCSALKRQGLKEVFDTAIAKTLEATQGLHPNKRGRAMSRGVFSLLRSVSPWRIVTAN
ncbi:hypothetical protein AB1Y20_020397 [Prymnesium parvum]|uniref:Uncharacterized protein n=1 Tax=Prymnesium parvum TaxID=97485 RepID=A0AB34JXH4_PRYPA